MFLVYDMYSQIEKIKIIRKKLLNREYTVGSWMQINSPDIAEIMSKASFDWIAVDLEHGAISKSGLPNIFRSLQLGDTLPLARLAEGTISNCKDALDAGAGGLIIPMIQDAIQLENIIKWSKWPPIGERGVGFSRANMFGENFDQYKKESEHLLIIAQIENIKAIDNLNEICDVNGLDAIIIGPYDLSASMGLTGQLNHPDVTRACEKIFKICRENEVPYGLHLVEPNKNKLKELIDNGHQFIAYSIDAVFLNSSLKLSGLK
jgi:2-dehydro-3-deoxyglucarate aldolase